MCADVGDVAIQPAAKLVFELGASGKDAGSFYEPQCTHCIEDPASTDVPVLRISALEKWQGLGRT